MNIFLDSRCSILGVLLVFLLRGSCADPDVELHRAVGDSLELIADYPKKDLEVLWNYNQATFAEYRNDDLQKVKSELFSDRLRMNKDSISVTVTDLKLQDSGRFSIVAENKSVQLKTKGFVLHVHDLIKEVKIEYDYVWVQSKYICMFDLRCVASGDENPSYSWISRQTQGQYLKINLSLGEKSTFNCTANNIVSIKYTIKTVECTEKTNNSTSGTILLTHKCTTWFKEAGSVPEFVLIAAGVGIVAVVIFGATLAVCCRWRRNRGQGESEAGITVYEDVNIDAPAKKRSESVVNGMTIYETVDDAKLSQNLPQTLYDKINYQRQPAGKTSTSTPSSYQEVL
ncbi:uncharacterized protein LOC113096654 [Carassius auratus]|uniref:Uncharacterized protein LOC113096654 n=1 Tax=Carassius auratus TaxID=7957 RepID=A0A6P6P9F8_CARAU|nr:uncharacterized protein LOC113096654 [Carassius auratus]